MHIRTYVNCFGNIALRMSSVHFGVSWDPADKGRPALRKSWIMPFLKKQNISPQE